MDIEKYIRDAAERGWSRKMTAEALGINRKKLYAMLEHMPDVKWPGPGESLACALANEARIGVPAPWARIGGEKGRERMRGKHQVEAFGVMDSLYGHAKRHGMSGSTICRRVRDGMTPEQALSTPPAPPEKRGQGRKGNVTIKHRKKAA